MKATKTPIHVVTTWIRRQPPKMKVFLAVLSGIVALLFLRMVVHDHANLFIAAEFVHALGISLLIYKLAQEKTCAGLSLKPQELTAIFLAVRLYCSLVMEYGIHTLLDTATLGTTLWVIYMMRFKLNSSYMSNKDSLAIYYVVIPCLVLSLLIHPTTRIIQLTGFSGLFVFILKLCLFSLSCGSCRTLRLLNHSQHTMFLPLEFQGS